MSVRIGGAATAVTPPPPSPDPARAARQILADNGRPGARDLPGIRRDLDAVTARDPALGAAVTREVEARLTPVERGQLAATTYSLAAPGGGSIAISSAGLTVAQHRAGAGGAEGRALYDRMDRIWGDGRFATDDTARIEAGLRELQASGLSLARYEALRASAAPAPADDGPSTATLIADLGQMALDLTGIVDPTPVSDGGNALISFGRAIGSAVTGDLGGAGGHLVNGVISTAAIVPVLGDAAKFGKIGKWAQTVSDAVGAVARNPAAREALEPALRQIRDAVNAIPAGALEQLPAGARESLSRMRGQLDELFGAGARGADEAAAAARPQIVMNGGRKGDWPPELNRRTLQPDTDYIVNGYTYRTDASGRVTSAEGTLDLRTAERNGYQQAQAGRADRAADDQGGHLIASIFNGPGDRLNLVPMNGNLNMGAWKRLENQLADALRDGKQVDVKIDVIYDGASQRPTVLSVEYNIDGATRVADFDNVPGGRR